MSPRVRQGLVLLAIAAVAAGFPAPASAVSVTLGRPVLTGGTPLTGENATFPLAYASSYNSALSSGLLTAPADGTITSWRVRGETQDGGHLTLHVMRAEADGRFKSTADS